MKDVVFSRIKAQIAAQKQCDQMAWLFVQYLAIYIIQNRSKRIKELQKKV